MRIYFLLFILTGIFFQSQAQTTNPAKIHPDSMGNISTIEDDGGKIAEEIIPDSLQVFSFVGEMPKFMGGGDDVLIPYIQKNIKYPKDAQELKIKGTVYIQYIIERNGSVSNVAIVPGRSIYPSLDQAAIDVIKNLPKWTPGYNNGVPVRVKKLSRISFN